MEASLSDSPWELCLLHCLAFKHTCICQFLSSVPSSNSYKPWPRGIFPVQTGMFARSRSRAVLPCCLLREFTVASWKPQWHEVLEDVWLSASTSVVVFPIQAHTHTQKQTQRKGKLHLDDTVIRQPLCSLPVTHISLHQWKSSTSWQRFQSLVALRHKCFKGRFPSGQKVELSSYENRVSNVCKSSACLTCVVWRPPESRWSVRLFSQVFGQQQPPFYTRGYLRSSSSNKLATQKEFFFPTFAPHI